MFWLLVEFEVHPLKNTRYLSSTIAGPSLAGRTLYVLTVPVFAWITPQPCIRHDYTYTTVLLYRHRVRFVVSSDIALNPACGWSAIAAGRPILIPQFHHNHRTAPSWNVCPFQKRDTTQSVPLRCRSMDTSQEANVVAFSKVYLVTIVQKTRIHAIHVRTQQHAPRAKCPSPSLNSAQPVRQT